MSNLQILCIAILGVSSLVTSLVTTRLFGPCPDSMHEMRLVSLLVCGVVAVILAPVNVGLSLLLGIAALPYSLLFLPLEGSRPIALLLNPQLVFVVVGLAWNNWNVLLLENTLNEILVTQHLLGGWVVPVIFLAYQPMNNAFLLSSPSKTEAQ